jgi:hypothetical protein
MSEQHPHIGAPPLMPTGEIAARENSGFNARCLAFVAPFLEKGNWEFQRGLVTRSPNGSHLTRRLRYCRFGCTALDQPDHVLGRCR